MPSFIKPLQSGEIQELRKMMSAHVKDVTALQKKISTLVRCLSLCVWGACSYHCPFYRKQGLSRREQIDTVCWRDARYSTTCCVVWTWSPIVIMLVCPLQLEDIKLPMRRGRMEDIGDEQVRSSHVATFYYPTVACEVCSSGSDREAVMSVSVLDTLQSRFTILQLKMYCN